MRGGAGGGELNCGWAGLLIVCVLQGVCVERCAWAVCSDDVR